MKPATFLAKVEAILDLKMFADDYWNFLSCGIEKQAGVIRGWKRLKEKCFQCVLKNIQPKSKYLLADIMYEIAGLSSY